MTAHMLYSEMGEYVRFIRRNPYIFNLSHPPKKEKKKRKKDGMDYDQKEAPPLRKRPEDFPDPKPMSQEELADTPFVKDIVGK